MVVGESKNSRVVPDETGDERETKPETKQRSSTSEVGETARKQLIVAVEGTAAVGAFWQTIFSDYLERIIRYFCGNNTTNERHSKDLPELSLIMFTAHGPYSACLVQRSGWTTNMEVFFQWLSALPFVGGGFSDAAIAEGLAEALLMFSSTHRNKNQNAEAHKHCVLIAASNPYPLPTPVYRPQPQNLEKSDFVETQPYNPLYDAETLAKYFPQCDVSLSVICPKQLPKLRGIYNAAKHDPQAADPAVDNFKNPQFLVLISENFMDARASLNRTGMADLPSNKSPVKADEISIPSVSRPSPAPYPSGVTPISGSLLIPANAQVMQNSAPAPFISSTTNVPTNNNVGVPQPMTNPQGCSSMDQKHPVMSQGNVPISQMVHTGRSGNQNLINTMASVVPLGASGATMPTPAMSQQGQSEMQRAAVNSNSPTAHTLLPQPPSSEILLTEQKYVKIWEGNLCGQRQGQSFLVTKLVGYTRPSLSKTLAANWPPAIRIDHVASKAHLNNKKFTGKADYIAFQAMNQHDELVQLQEKKLLAVIGLPSQTLFLGVSDKVQQLFGLVFPVPISGGQRTAKSSAATDAESNATRTRIAAQMNASKIQ